MPAMIVRPILAAWLHRIDPFLIQFSEQVGLRWYGLSYVIGFLLAYALMRWLARTGRSRLNPEAVGDFVFTVALGTVIGGRLGYCVFYQPHLLIDFNPAFPFWGALRMWEGGMASHGGILGMLVGCVIHARRTDRGVWHLLDLCAITAPIGVCFGRVANFINGELVGRAVRPDFPLAVKFPQDILDWPRYAPEKLPQLRPILRELGLPAGERLTHDALQQVVRTVQSTGEQADRIAGMLEPLLTARHPAQLYAAGLEGLLVFAVLAGIWLRPRRPGVIAGACLLTYGIVRIGQELFRRPDLHIGFQALGLTRGQWLSVALVLGGATLLCWCARRRAEPIGGWGRAAPPA